MTGYAELHVTSNYSFLRGASHIEELFAQAKLRGLPAIGITDRNPLAGIARAHQRAEEAGIRLVVGCRLDLRDGLRCWSIRSTALPTRDCAAYSPLARHAPGKVNVISAGRTSLPIAKGCSPSFCRTPQTRHSQTLLRG